MTHESSTERAWKSVTTPFAVDLFAVTQTAEGPFAVGGSGTVAAERSGGWEMVVDQGPAGKNRTLRAVDVTDDGTRVWFAGASGAIGMYDLERGRLYDYSYAKDVSASWKAIAVTGSRGAESLVVANGSGTVLPFDVDGLEPTYGTPVTPGSGAAITALAYSADGVGYAVDTGGHVFQAAVDGWTAVGIEAAQASLRDVTVGPEGRVYVASGSGTLYRRDPQRAEWVAIEVPGSALRAVDVFEGHVAVLATGNTAYRRPVEGRDRWRSESLPAGNEVVDLALAHPDVAVGKSGTVVERPRASDPGAPPESPGEPADPVDVCDLLLTELVSRLDREELVSLLREREGCGASLVEHLAENPDETVPAELLEEFAAESLLVLPVAGEGVADGTRCEVGHGTCECHESRQTLASLDRLLGGC